LKNVVITGASGGIGKELPSHFGKNWNVIATTLPGTRKKNLQIEYKMFRTRCHLLKVQLDAVNYEAKSIDLVVNNAGVGYRSFRTIRR
jgi:short-subunit dehydrogenase